MNKLWNAAKLVDMGGAAPDFNLAEVRHPVNRWMLARVAEAARNTTASFERYIFGDAGDALQSSLWTNFCDFYLEAAKEPSLAELPETKAMRHSVLDVYLRLLHPFLPFVTEEIWQKLGRKGWLMTAKWPAGEIDLPDDVTPGMESVMRLITGLRSFRSALKLSWTEPLSARLQVKKHGEVFDACRAVIARLANVRWSEDAMEGEPLSDDAFEVTVAAPQLTSGA